MKRYKITLNIATATADIFDNVTKTTVTGKIGKYHRDGETKYEVRFDNKQLDCEKRGVVQVPKDKSTNKFMRVFESDLTKKQCAIIDETDF